jgi:hypothetical protein
VAILKKNGVLWRLAIVVLQSSPCFAQSTQSTILDNYFNIATDQTAAEFRPMTFTERKHLLSQSVTNPLSYIDTAISAGMDHAEHKPKDWDRGAAGYGERFANIAGQSLVRKGVEFGLASMLHEDNRYFNSGQTGVWRRSIYALKTTARARHDNGRLYPSVSNLAAIAVGAFVARTWLPPGERSAKDAAFSIGLTVAGDAAGSMLKEFMPDIKRVFRKKHRPSLVAADDAEGTVFGRPDISR